MGKTGFWRQRQRPHVSNPPLRKNSPASACPGSPVIAVIRERRGERFSRNVGDCMTGNRWGIDYLLEVNAEHSRVFCDPSTANRRRSSAICSVRSSHS